VVAVGAYSIVASEFLGSLREITRPALASVWLLASAAAIYRLRRANLKIPKAVGFADSILLSSIAAILAIVGFVAFLSPPNTFDSLAYHLPRVVFWAQQQSVSFFATPYLNQIQLQPFAEYFMLQSFVLSGGDHFVNFVQWAGFLISIVAVSLIAGQFGAQRRGQIIAALFVATLPNGILQASGAKNDYFMAGWLSAAVWFLLRGDPVWSGLALALAIGTKATAYLYAAPLIVVIFVMVPAWRNWKRVLTFVCLTLSLNLPQFARNVALSGSPFGFDSPFGDERFRWRNERFGWRQTASNIIRNSTEQMGYRDARWNRFVYDSALKAHRLIGARADDQDTTWLWSNYAPPRNTNHEADAPNSWHLLLFLVTLLTSLIQRRWRLAMFGAALVVGFVAFCAYLKWQPYMARMFLPLFVLAAPIAGVVIGSIRGTLVHLALCLVLLNNARPFLFDNWLRPLRGVRSVLHAPRETQYFADMKQFDNQQSFLDAVNASVPLACSTFGIDINDFQIEYPFEALLLERRPNVRFVHTGVSNQSRKYQQVLVPCAVLCLDCAGDSNRTELYRKLGEPQQFGKFLFFTR
jgi:hypothetical protein